MTLGIITASPFEANSLCPKKTVMGSTYSIGDTALLTAAGIGPQAAQQAAERLVSQGVSALLSWGVAAGLDTNLNAGSIAMPTQLLHKKTKFKVDGGWHKKIKKQITELATVYEGTSVHTDEVLCEPTQKQTLHTNSNAIIADMESATIAAVAKQANIAFLSIRVVSDPAHIALPAVLAKHLSKHKNPDILRLVFASAIRPWQWVSCYKFALGSHIALRQLNKIGDALQSHLSHPNDLQSK